MPSLSQLGIPTLTPLPLVEAELNHGYPRPQLRRQSWVSLNGEWDFAIDENASWTQPKQVVFDKTITVPFAAETENSGIGEHGFFRACWYRRTLTLPTCTEDESVILHFGAVDYFATVFVDDIPVASHEGGYTPFEVDISSALVGKDQVVLCVRAMDDPTDLSKPRGKQDWQLNPHSIWYPRTSGIWQTVWVECVPKRRIQSLRWTPSLERWELGLEALIRPSAEKLRLRVRLRARSTVLADDTYLVIAHEVQRRIALSDPGIDDFRNSLLWSPETPTLIMAELTLIDEQGTIIDAVSSYTALRQVACQGDRFTLNGRPYPLRLVLDQGYWPQSGQTPPNDEALRKDVELTKAMGFNGVRKHQKIEDPRYLFWADHLGLLVWEEMPSAYRFTRRSIKRVTSQWMEVLERDASHPCIVTWVPFNESWGVPNLPDSAAERHYVQTIYHLTRSLDPTRPVVGNDGWESSATDIIGVHDYDPNPERMAKRYNAHDLIPRFLQHERPGGRQLILEGHSLNGRPMVLSEFGGIALGDDSKEWGYSRCRTPQELSERYRELLHCVHSIGLFAGFCYTQFADTYQEANGLLRADRTPKFPLSEIRLATMGASALLNEATVDSAAGPTLAREGSPP